MTLSFVIIRAVIASFGGERVVWGSDWPVCTLRATYDQWIATAHALTDDLPAADREAIFGGNAIRFYKLDE